MRDLLIGRPVKDIDLTLEGDAVGFGRALAARLGARARVHERFGTAALEFPDGSRLDVAASRAESYAAPGALPRVEPAPIAADLARRDFTINAMALQIAPGRIAKLLDPFGGAADLRRGLVKMLHAASARDDPTRAFRAARYAGRLGFSIDSETRRWVRAALAEGAFEAVSGQRLTREIRLLFSEANPAEAARNLCRLGLHRALHASLSCAASGLARLRRGERIARRDVIREPWFLYLLLWAAELDERRAGELANRLSLPRREAEILRSWPRTREALTSGGKSIADPRRALSEWEIAAAEAIPAREAERKKTARAIAAAHLELRVRGSDLVAAGVPAGPRIGRALAATRAARQQGTIAPEEELRFALHAARSEPS